MSNSKFGCGHLGNGLTVWDRSIEVAGDYKRIAHISPEREITWLVKRPTQEMKDYVNQLASGPNMAVSTSQPDILVFREE